MDILSWIDVGKVSAERDDLLSCYFFDNGVLKKVIDSPSSFLILGRKGAGKTAVFKYLSENHEQFISKEDVLIPLSFDDYNWNIHSLLVDSNKAVSLAYKQSWKFVILIECIKAYKNWYEQRDKPVPKQIKKANKILENIFDTPVPTMMQIVGRKLLSLSNATLPSGGFGEEGEINFTAGEVSFEEVKADNTLKQRLSENIENLIDYFDSVIESINDVPPRIFICFDRVDEAWDDVSYEASKRVIAGLVSASDSISNQYKGRIRPIIFLREDIFNSLSLNDSNKLREDCGALLHWNKDSLSNLMLHRINYFADRLDIGKTDDIDKLFDKKEMRQRLKPFSYILKRTMMRPRDFISIMGKVITTMKAQVDDPFADNAITYELLEVESIYNAEPSYSDWLKQEIIDEWSVQKPIINDLLSALQNNGSTNFTKDDLVRELNSLNISTNTSEVISHLRFLFENSIIGFKLGGSTQWKYKCFYPGQGFLDSDEYKVHDGLVRSLNLRENREREQNTVQA